MEFLILIKAYQPAIIEADLAGRKSDNSITDETDKYI
jgi:hypothetical protein